MAELKLMMLDSEGAANMWDTIYPAIESALPKLEETEMLKRRNYLHSSVLKKVLQVWLLIELPANVLIVGTSVPYADLYTGDMDLLLYTVHSYGSDLDTWITAYEKLRKFCKAHNYKKIVAFGVNPKVVELAKALNATTTTFIELEV